MLLGAVFLALGLMVSAWVRERGTAAGLAIGIWLLLVLIYDLALLGLLASDVGRLLDDRLVTTMLLANPTDVYRMLNLAGSADAQALSAMAGIAGTGTASPICSLRSLPAGCCAPSLLACQFFRRRQL